MVNLREDVTLQVRKKVGGLLHLGEGYGVYRTCTVLYIDEETPI